MYCSECAIKLDPGNNEKIVCPRCDNVMINEKARWANHKIPCISCGIPLTISLDMKNIICYDCGNELIINHSDFSGFSLKESGILHKLVIEEPTEKNISQYLY